MESESQVTLSLDRVRDLSIKLQGLRQCYNVMRKHGAAIQRALTDFELSFEKSNTAELGISTKISENCVLFGVAAHALMGNCDSFLNAVQFELANAHKLMRRQKIQIQNLEKIVRNPSKGSTMELRNVNFISKLRKRQSKVDFRSDAESECSDNEDRVDSLNYLRQTVQYTTPTKTPASTTTPTPSTTTTTTPSTTAPTPTTTTPETPETEALEDSDKKLSVVDSKHRIRRSTIPERPNISFNTWNFLKTIIGKDLSKIPVPVNFNEPLSLLQRITEDLHNADLLDSAAEIVDDKSRQLAYVVAFSISTYACDDFRTGKPFNPLLGETYELDRTEDLGWRSIAEQVSHHPPISALHCEGRGWVLWLEISVSSKFKGKTLHVETTGIVTCKFLKSGNTYSWTKVPTVVKNIIVGTMWLDHYGQVDIIGSDAAAGHFCELIFDPYSSFISGRQRCVHGVIKDENETAKLLIRGYWDYEVEIAPVLSFQKSNRAPTYETGKYEKIWTRVNFEQRRESTYYFSNFTCELNEPEEGVPPTDCRLRPDIRLMEQGLWDESNLEKLRLEESQRARRKINKASGKDDEGEEPPPIWFERDDEKEKILYKYKQTYWEAKSKQDWSQCPRIF